MNVPDNLKNVHMHGGKTHAQMEEIRIKQINGEVEMVPANRGKNITDQFFAREYGDYKIPEHETDNYHVAMEARLFDANTGVKKSKSRVQIFDPMTFDQLVKNNAFHGHVTCVLHDPTLGAGKKGKNSGKSGKQPETPETPQTPPPATDSNETDPDIDNSGEFDPSTIDLNAITTLADARAAYKGLTGKNPAPNMDVETIKLKIAEINGDVK